MEERHRKVLQKSIMQFRKDFTQVKAVTEALWANDILSESMKADVLSQPTIHEQASALHTLMPKRGKKAFNAYYLALREVREDDLAKILEKYVTCDVPPEEPNREQATHVQESGDMGDETDLPDKWPDLSLDPLDVKVEKCDTTDGKMKRLFENDKDVYNMKGKRQGVKVLIINNKKFENPAQDTKDELVERLGTDIDATCLDLLFKELGYKNMPTKHDLNGQAILDAIRTAAADCQVTDNAFICVILSHGNASSVYGKDGVPVKLESIYELLDGAHCPNLAGKPKIFIIQACQGGKKDRIGHYQQQAQPESTEDPTVDLDDVQKEFQSLRIAQESPDAGLMDPVPIKSDILVATATTPGYVSWRNSKRGSWFIQALVYIIKNFAHKCDLLKMLTLTNRLVTRAVTTDKKHKQVSSKSDTFTKDFYFFPGFEEESPFSL